MPWKEEWGVPTRCIQLRLWDARDERIVVSRPKRRPADFGRVLHSPTRPRGGGVEVGTVWYSENENKPYVWTGKTWRRLVDVPKIRRTG